MKSGDEIHLYGQWTDASSISVDDPYFTMEDQTRSSGLTDSRYTIQKAMNIAKYGNAKITVKIPADMYYTSGSIHVFSNTTVVLDNNASIRRLTNSGHIFIVADAAKGGGYKQASNVTIKGGTLIGNPRGDYNVACLVRFNHCKNVSLKNCTIENYSGKHAVIFAGVKYGTVDNVTFEDFVLAPGSSLASAKLKTLQDAEALHIDDCTKAGEAVALPVDNTICDNITVKNCVFDNVLSGVGSHVPDVTSGGIIKILNNEFHNVKYYCIDMYNRTNSVVKGNKVYIFESFLRNYKSTIVDSDKAQSYEITESDKTGMRELYANVLNSVKNYNFPTAGSEISTYEYFLDDLNGDGIRELIVGAVYIGEDSGTRYHDCIIFTCRKSSGSYKMRRITGSAVTANTYIPSDSNGLYDRNYNSTEEESTISRWTIVANTLYENKVMTLVTDTEDEIAFNNKNQRVVWMNIANKVAISTLPE